MQAAERRQPGPAVTTPAALSQSLDCATALPALIAACSYIGHADGTFDDKEQRRIVSLARVLPLCRGAQEGEVAFEVARWQRAFAIEPRSARMDALGEVASLRLDEAEARQFLAACQYVLEADGVFHPSEYQALQEIGQAMGSHDARHQRT
jgi:tellurite resistance protein